MNEERYNLMLAIGLGITPSKRHDDENVLISEILEVIKSRHDMFHQNIGYNILSIFRLTNDNSLDDIYRELQSGNSTIMANFFTALIDTKDYNVNEIKMFVNNEMFWYTPKMISKFIHKEDRYDVVRLCDKKYAPGVAMKIMDNPKLLETNPNAREQIKKIFARYDDNSGKYFSGVSRQVAESAKTVFRKEMYVDVDDEPSKEKPIDLLNNVARTPEEYTSIEMGEKMLFIHPNFSVPKSSYRIYENQNVIVSTKTEEQKKLMILLQQKKYDVYDDPNTFKAFKVLLKCVEGDPTNARKNLTYIKKNFKDFISKINEIENSYSITYESLGIPKSLTGNPYAKKLILVGFAELDITSISEGSRKIIFDLVYTDRVYLREEMDSQFFNNKKSSIISTYISLLKNCPQAIDAFKNFVNTNDNADSIIVLNFISDYLPEIYRLKRKYRSRKHIYKYVQSALHETKKYKVSYLYNYPDDASRVYKELVDKGEVSTFFSKEINEMKRIFTFINDSIDYDELDKIDLAYVEYVEALKDIKEDQKKLERKNIKHAEMEKKSDEILARINRVLEEKPYSIKSFYNKSFRIPYEIVPTIQQKDVKFIKELRPELYEQYSALTERNRKRMFSIMMTKYEAFITKLDNYGWKKVSIFDAAVEIPFFTMDKFRKDCDMFDGDARRNMLRWYDRVKPGTFYTKYETIYHDKLIFGGRELTNDEKRDIINFMNFNNFPMYLNLFKLTARKYISGEIDIHSKVRISKKVDIKEQTEEKELEEV